MILLFNQVQSISWTLCGNYKNRMLLTTYTSNWVKDFMDIKRESKTDYTDLIILFEHIGSTSVANLDSKAIIDIDIIYSKQSYFEKIKLGLQEIGYYHNGNQGIEQRDVFKR